MDYAVPWHKIMYYVYKLYSDNCPYPYIGRTENILRRYLIHIRVNSNYKKITFLGRNIIQYGADTFKIEILEKTDDYELSKSIEYNYIHNIGYDNLLNTYTYQSNKGRFNEKTRKHDTDVMYKGKLMHPIEIWEKYTPHLNKNGVAGFIKNRVKERNSIEIIVSFLVQSKNTHLRDFQIWKKEHNG